MYEENDASEKPGITGQPSLKVAYHQACLKCHWGDVGSAGKNLGGCTEMCHVPKAPGAPEKKKYSNPRVPADHRKTCGEIVDMNA